MHFHSRFVLLCIKYPYNFCVYITHRHLLPQHLNKEPDVAICTALVVRLHIRGEITKFPDTKTKARLTFRQLTVASVGGGGGLQEHET